MSANAHSRLGACAQGHFCVRDCRTSHLVHILSTVNSIVECNKKAIALAESR